MLLTEATALADYIKANSRNLQRDTVATARIARTTKFYVVATVGGASGVYEQRWYDRESFESSLFHYPASMRPTPLAKPFDNRDPDNFKSDHVAVLATLDQIQTQLVLAAERVAKAYDAVGVPRADLDIETLIAECADVSRYCEAVISGMLPGATARLAVALATERK